jgi:hypothetical protein
VVNVLSPDTSVSDVEFVVVNRDAGDRLRYVWDDHGRPATAVDARPR